MFLVMALLVPLTVGAVEVEINGLWYNVDTSGSTAQVIKYKSSEYTGNISIPNSVTYSGKSYSVTSIGQSAFEYCFGLTSITLPNSVTSIGDGAFSGCEYLSSINIPNSLTFIGEGAFYHCSALSSIIIPNGVTSISSYTFGECHGLTSITIPNSVTSIGQEAFWNCDVLTAITIPSGVTAIGESAFDRCHRLTSITINKDTPISISSDTFSERANATLYVPYRSKAAYEAASYWKEFKEIIEMDDRQEHLVKGDVNGDGKASITDIVLIIDVIAGSITDANKVEAADVNGDGSVSNTDCVAALDLIASSFASTTDSE